MRSWSLMLIALCFAGCDTNRAEVELCSVESGYFNRESLRFNLQEQLIFGSDTTFGFEVIESKLVKGFVLPFPLVLPKYSSSSSVPDRWELGGYTFSVTKPSSEDPELILIHASPLKLEQASGAVQRTSVLYSFSGGVLALQLWSQFEEETLFSDLYFCGTGRLDASTF